MDVGDDGGLLFLSHDLSEFGVRNQVGLKQVLQHRPRSNTESPPQTPSAKYDDVMESDDTMMASR